MESNEEFSLLFLDLDGFKAINDSHGHQEGDNVLKEVAKRLNESLSENHFIARLGGDEFVCIYNKYTEEHFASLIQELLENITKSYGVNQDINGLSVSIGVSQYPQDSEDSFELKNYADRAMYQAKRNGKNQIVYYNEMNK